MHRCSGLACFVLLLSAGAVSASAQQATAFGVECRNQHPGITSSSGAHPYGPRNGEWWSAQCTGDAACDQAWANHLRQWHSGSGGGSAPPIPPSRPRTPLGALVTVTASTSAAVALLGSFGTTDGVNQWRNGAIGGAGLGLVFGAAATSHRIPVVVGAALSIGGGALAGKQVGDFQVSQGKEETNKRDTLIGAAAGFVTYGVGRLAIGPASPNLAPRWMGAKGKLNFIVTGRWLGVIARW